MVKIPLQNTSDGVAGKNMVEWQKGLVLCNCIVWRPESDKVLDKGSVQRPGS